MADTPILQVFLHHPIADIAYRKRLIFSEQLQWILESESTYDRDYLALRAVHFENGLDILRRDFGYG